MDEIAKSTNGTLKKPPFNSELPEWREYLKSWDRAMEKIDLERKLPEEVLDILRATIKVENYKDIPRSFAKISERFKIIKVKDKYSFPNENWYRDINILVEMTSPSWEKVFAEVQLNTRVMLEAKAIETDLYTEIRVLDKKLENETITQEEIIRLEALQKESIEVYKKAWEDFTF